MMVDCGRTKAGFPKFRTRSIGPASSHRANAKSTMTLKSMFRRILDFFITLGSFLFWCYVTFSALRKSFLAVHSQFGCVNKPVVHGYPAGRGSGGALRGRRLT